MQPFPSWGRGDSWLNSNKLWLALAEVMVPSWIGVPGLIGFVFHMFIFAVVLGAATLAAVPVAQWASSLTEPGLHHNLLVRSFGHLLNFGAMLAVICFYPVLLLGRLHLLVREANEYYRTQTPPVWRRRPAFFG